MVSGDQSAVGLNGKVVLVTGAAGGIGAATAALLAERGARVVLSDVSENAETVASDIRAKGLDAQFIEADVSNEASVESLINSIVAKFGQIDGAFNNAGVEQCATPLAELSAEQWDRAIRIDLTGVFYCMKHEIRAMQGAGGSIVNTASALGEVALKNASEYVAAKHGVVGLTRAGAADYGDQGIRVNAVLPGIINTPMVKRLSDDPNFAQFFDKLRQRHPIGRFGVPAEIGGAVSWLLSDDASFVNGAAISVDGGYLAV